MLNGRMEVLMLVTMFLIGGETARILAHFPTPSISHQIVFRSLIQGLLARGHEVTVITPDPMYRNETAPANLTEIDLRDVSHELWNKVVITPGSMTGEKESTYQLIQNAHVMLVELLEKQVLSNEIQNLIHDKTNKFDVILGEGYLWTSMCLSHVYKVPVLLISSLGPNNMNLKINGSPRHPLLHPTFLHQDIYNHSLKEKAKELYNFYFMNSVYENHDISADKMLKRVFGKDAPTVNEMKSNVIDLLFLNVHNLWDTNRPVANNIIYTGGLHLVPEKDLPNDLKQYLDSSKNGVIYVTFGTNADAALFPADRLKLLLNVFSKLPYDILWKWNGEELPGRSQNIRISKWLPQMDILKHPKVKVLVFQGGLQSTDEAITGGIPMVAIPILGDQWYNAQQVVKQRIGVQLDLGSLTEEVLTNHILRVINDESYRKNVAKLRTVLNDKPQKSLERAIWWIEYAIRHKGSTLLRPPSFNMNWTQYFEIELLAYLVSVLLVLTVSFVYFIRNMYAVFNHNIFRFKYYVKNYSLEK